MQRAMLGFQLLYIFEGNHLNNHNLIGQVYNVGYYLFIFFQNNCGQNYSFHLFFIDNEKAITFIQLRSNGKVLTCIYPWYTHNGSDIARDTHCNITMGNDFAREICCYVTMSNDIAMSTSQCIMIWLINLEIMFIDFE